VAGNDHDRQLRLAFPESLHQRQAVHAGHVDVGYHDVEGLFVE